MRTPQESDRFRNLNAGRARLWRGARLRAFELLEERHLLSGTRLGEETRVAPADHAADYAQTLTSPAVAVQPDSSFAIAYTNQDEPAVGDDVYLRRFDPDRSLALSNDLVSLATHRAGDQDRVVVATLPENSLVAAWYDRGCAESLDGACAAPFDASDAVYARRIDSSGVALDAEEWRINADVAGAQSEVTVATDTSGGMTFIWTGQDTEGLGGVWLRRFDAEAQPIDSGDVRIFAGGLSTESPTAAMDAAGNLAVAWSVVNTAGDHATDELHGLYFGIGEAEPSEFVLTAADDALGRWPSLAMDADGNFVAAFTRDSGTDGEIQDSNVYVRRFAIGGEPIDATPFLVNTTLSGVQEMGRVAVAADGGFLVVWSGRGDVDGEADDAGIFGQRFDRGADPIGGEFRVNTTVESSQFGPSAAVAPRGDAVVVWNGFGNQIGPAPENLSQQDWEGVFFQQLDFVAPKGEIEVRGKGRLIGDGDDTPSPEDGTHFGEAVLDETSATQTFVIQNIGQGKLWFVGDPTISIAGENAGDFTLEYTPVAFLPPDGALDVKVTFRPSGTGLRRATVVIVTDDGDETPYEFSLEGIGLSRQAPWQNPRDPYDVNGDGVVSGLDALILINHLNSQGPHNLPAPGDGSEPPPYLDVNGDNKITPLDALQVINLLNSRRPPLAGSLRAQPTQGMMIAPLAADGLQKEKSRRAREEDASLRAAQADLVFTQWPAGARDQSVRRATRRLWA